MKKFIALLMVAVMTMAMCTTVFAADIDVSVYGAGDANNTVYLLADDTAGFPGYAADNGIDITTITTVTWYVKATDTAGEWFGGQVGTNSAAGGWGGAKASWGTDDSQNIVFDLAAFTGGETVAITLDVTGIFQADDSYAQLYLQTYGAGIELVGVSVATAAAAGDMMPVVSVAMVAMVACAAFVVLRKKEA